MYVRTSPGINQENAFHPVMHPSVIVLGHLADRLDTNGSGRHALDKPDQSGPPRYGFDRSPG
jgi:hypothetical protein